MRISDWSSDVCSSDLAVHLLQIGGLTFGGGRNFSDQGAHFADPHDDMIQRLASPANQVDPARHLTGACADQFLNILGGVGGTLGQCADLIGDHSKALACIRSEEHTSELQSLMRISYAVFCLKKKKKNKNTSKVQ